MNSALATMKYIKQEDECCFCFSKENLFNMSEPYNFEENVEIYLTMIAECFQIEFCSYIEECDRNLYFICKNCVFRLRDAIMLRSQIQIAYDRLIKAKCCKKDDQDVITSEYSDGIETKEHILKYDYSEYDNTECNTNVYSGVSLSNENVFKLKPVKIVVEKIDKVLENIFSAKGGSGVKYQPSKIFFCNICNKLFRNLRAMQTHKRSHRITKEKTCEYCNKTFQTYRNLLRHQKIHFDIRDYFCDYCKRGFRQKEYLREHILVHLGIKNVKCDMCDKCFVSKKAVSSHKRESHPDSIKMCKHCNKTFPTNNKLLRHEKIHVKDFICDYCKRGFPLKEHLKEHVLLHIGCNKCKLQKKSLI